MPGRVVIVGLGPAGADHLLPVARAALASDSRRFVRTARHPAVAQLAAEGIELESFDESYERAPDLDAAYDEMVRTLLDAAAAAPDGDAVVYAVPGNPAVAERTVALLHEAAARGDVDVTVVAGLSFTDLAWARLGVDPMARDARVVDGRAIDDAELSGPLLIAQCDNAFVLSDVKLTLLEHLDPATTVTVLQRLGLPDERITTVELADLDRVVEPDHLTSLFVNVETGAAGAAREIVRLLQLAKRLRDPGGCPWDAEQTHHSLTRYLLEESYEVVEAVEALPLEAPGGDVPVPEGAYAALEDELGDLFYEVVFHAVLAEEAGGFTMADVARGIHDKLVRRHPHVFGDVVADEATEVVKNWEQIKLDGEGHDLARRRHHARPAVAPLHQQAVPQGRVDRSRSRQRRRSARPHRPRARAPPRRRPRARGRARAGARRRRRPRACGWRRRRVRVARLGGALPRPLRGDGAPRRGTRPRSRRPRRRGRHRAVAGGGQSRVIAGTVPMRPALKSSIASDDLALGVHHERAVVHDGLPDRETAEQQHVERVGRAFDVLGRAQRDAVTGPEHDQRVVGHGPRLGPAYPWPVSTYANALNSGFHGTDELRARRDGRVPRT